MRRLLIALAVIGLWFIGGQAEAGDCSSIRTGDERAYCRAEKRKQKSYCTAIMGYDLRQTCFARLGAPATVCAYVKPGWPRLQCQDAARK